MCEHFLFLIAKNLASNLVADPFLQSYREHGPSPPLSATGIFIQCDMITKFFVIISYVCFCDCLPEYIVEFFRFEENSNL